MMGGSFEVFDCSIREYDSELGHETSLLAQWSPRQPYAHSFRLILLSHAGSVNVVLLHTPKIVQFLLLKGAALTKCLCSCSTDRICDGGRNNCGNNESNCKCSETILGRHGGFSVGWGLAYSTPRTDLVFG